MDERNEPGISPHDLSQRGGKRNKHLIFSLEDRFFGVPLLQVKEIIAMVNVTAIPDSPAYLKGIINLRGQVISIIDLKRKLAFARGNDVKRPCVVICEFGRVVLGSVVDDVVEVLGFEEKDLEHSLDIQNAASREYITGVARDKTRGLILLLDLGRVLNAQELVDLRKQLLQQPKAA